VMSVVKFLLSALLVLVRPLVVVHDDADFSFFFLLREVRALGDMRYIHTLT